LPDNLKKAFAADNEKQMNFTSVTDFKQISIEKHDSPSYGIYSST
jgi:hypothetical protein